MINILKTTILMSKDPDPDKNVPVQKDWSCLY